MSLFTESIFAEGNTAVITGASSGIGRATALYCASVGMQVWMVDIDEEELLAAQKLVETKSEKQKVVARVVNVADAAAMEALAQEVFSTEGSCQFLMNNAGIDGGGKGALPSMELVQKVMSVNTFGPMHGCLAFLPLMKKQSSNNEALVINTGSKQGITMPPGNLTYNMSKAALKVYTEGLEHELYTERKQGLHQIHAALLVPGWVNTSIALKQMLSEGKTTEDCFFHEDKPAKGAWMPSQIVEFMLQELNKGPPRFYIICPDNDVTRQVDNVRMTWTMQDIVQNRPPLSRWHDDYKDQFQEFLKESLQENADK